MTAHIQPFSEPGLPVRYRLDRSSLDILVTLLSYSLQVAASTDDIAAETPHNDNITQVGDMTYPSESSTSVKQENVLKLVGDILQAASDLMLVSKTCLIYILSPFYQYAFLC